MVAAAAAILCGGRGERLGGVVKPHLEIGGARILDRALAVLRPLFDDIAIVSDDAAPYADAGLPVVADEQPGLGPLGGIAAALAWSPHARVFVVAGDMPFLDARAIELLLTRPGAAVAPRVGGHAEPLHAVYHRDCLPFIRARLRSGDVKTAALLDEVGAQYVGEDALRELDRELRFLTNVNTPSDLQNATASVSS